MHIVVPVKRTVPGEEPACSKRPLIPGKAVPVPVTQSVSDVTGEKAVRVV
jgi:hypothetical protein